MNWIKRQIKIDEKMQFISLPIPFKGKSRARWSREDDGMGSQSNGRGFQLRKMICENGVHHAVGTCLYIQNILIWKYFGEGFKR